MKSFGVIGAAFLLSATLATSFASEVPAGGWREAACCQSNALGQCVRWCEPAAGAVRGERPVVKEPAEERPKGTEPKNGAPKQNDTK